MSQEVRDLVRRLHEAGWTPEGISIVVSLPVYDIRRELTLQAA